MPALPPPAWIEAFDRAVAHLDAGDVEVTVLHQVDGDGAWRIVVAAGTVRVRAVAKDAPVEPADLVFTWQPDDAQAVAEGRLSPLIAFQAGRLRIAGDLTRLAEVAELFARFPAVPAVDRA